MRFPLLLLCSLLLTFALGSQAQRRQKVVRPAVEKVTISEAIEQYDFRTAARLLQSALTHASTPERQDTLRRLLHQVELGQQLLPNTERIVFIDSIVVSKSQLLDAIRLSPDAGRLVPTASLFRPDALPRPRFGTAAFVNPLNNAAFFSASIADASLRLQSVYRSATGWGAPSPLPGIDSLHLNPDFPFMLSDGTTLYFSAEGPESMGGYDLFVTRYNPETRQYRRPTPLGMPFNSPANDYLYLIDPAAGIGLFATDRRQPDGKVCLYTFLPSTEHSTFDAQTTSEKQLIQAAQLHNIAATQTDARQAVAAARHRRQNSSPTKAPVDPNFRFVVNDRQVYTSLHDFRHPEARTKAQAWRETQQQLDQLLKRQNELQLDFSTTRSEHQAQELRRLETQITELRLRLNTLAKETRRLELGQ